GDSGHSGFGVAVADFGGSPGVAWLESDPTASNPGALELHVAELSGGTWRALGGAVTASSTTHQPAPRAVARTPVVAWTRPAARPPRRLKRSGWTGTTGSAGRRFRGCR